jgi:hypothetical protein
LIANGSLFFLIGAALDRIAHRRPDGCASAHHALRMGTLRIGSIAHRATGRFARLPYIVR